MNAFQWWVKLMRCQWPQIGMGKLFHDRFFQALNGGSKPEANCQPTIQGLYAENMFEQARNAGLTAQEAMEAFRALAQKQPDLAERRGARPSKYNPFVTPVEAWVKLLRSKPDSLEWPCPQSVFFRRLNGPPKPIKITLNFQAPTSRLVADLAKLDQMKERLKL